MSDADYFRDAWRFLTIVRVSDSSQPFAADWLARSLKYFPARANIMSAAAPQLIVVDWSPFRSGLPRAAYPFAHNVSVRQCVTSIGRSGLGE